MARLQDFQTVTPTASDKLLVVQSQGQGLTTIGDFKSDKMDKANPTGTGALSLNRKSGTTIGTYSVAEGRNTEASGANGSHSEGFNTKAGGESSHAENGATQATGVYSHAEGYVSKAIGDRSHAEGSETIAQRKAQHVFGEFNVADTTGADGTVRGSYVEIVGKGTADNARSNARTLDWSGNEVLAGGLKINGNQDVTTYTSGSVTIPSTIAAGYITASGNYIDINVPILTAPNATIAVTSFNNSTTGIYLPTGGRLINALDTNYASVTRISKSFIRIEFKFTSTQTVNQMATMHLTDLVLSIT